MAIRLLVRLWDARHGARLRQARCTHGSRQGGLTQKELGDLVGCNFCTISNVERGKTPSQDLLDRLMAELDLTHEDLGLPTGPVCPIETGRLIASLAPPNLENTGMRASEIRYEPREERILT